MFHNGQCEVQPCFTGKAYQIVVNVFQATVLDLFNKGDEYKVEELMNRTQIPKVNFNGAVLAMCNPKFRVLNKEVKKPILEANEKISVNLQFKNNNIRVSVLPVQGKKEKEAETENTNKAIVDGVMKERNQIIEAHCVKQMKTNKVMQFNDLVQKVMASVTTFKAQP